MMIKPWSLYIVKDFSQDCLECIYRNVYVMLVSFGIMMDAPHIREDISILQSEKQFDGSYGIW